MKFPLFALLFLGLISHTITAADNGIDPDYVPITEDDESYTYQPEYEDISLEYNVVSEDYDDDEDLEAGARTFNTGESDDEEDAEGSSGSGVDPTDTYGGNKTSDIPEIDRFYCDHNTLILNKNKKCDGAADCGDCSDELDCPTSFNKLLSCYNDAPDKTRFYLPSRTPYCIPKKNFCNHQPTSCETEIERQNTGFGAKCFVKHQQQSCVLPIQVIMDNDVDCENGADEFKGRMSSRAEASLAERTYELGDLEKDSMFKCLSDDQIYIFKNQVCDGTLDCPDFSDECLCNVIPDRTLQACRAIFPVGSMATCDCNNPSCPDATCDCSGAEVRVKKTSTDRHMCISSGDICDKILMHKSPELKEMCALTTQQRTEPVGETVECFKSFDGEDLISVRAVKCDGNPECIHGDDECLPECKKAGALPEFCELWNGPNESYKCEDDLVATVCDGKRDCFNGTDELGCPDKENFGRTMTNVERQIQHCSYDSTNSNQNQLARREELLAQGCDVSSRQLWDGTPHCVNGADECPQFFAPGSSESLMQSAGISSYEHVIENSNIKNFISVCGAIGILTNLFAVVMCLVKWKQLFVRHRGDRVDDSAIFTLKLLHEGGFSFSLAVSKLCLSGYLFTMVTSSPGDTPYCASDLQWRTGSTCSFLGSLVMLTVPVGVYGAFLMAFVLFIVSSFTSMPTAHRTFCFQFLVSLAFIVLLWVPLALMVVIGPSNLNCHAWMSMDGSQLRATGNIVDRQVARDVLSCVSNLGLGAFSWPGFVDTLHRYAPGYHANLLGTFGYYSHSAVCLPLYLATAHPVSGCQSGSLSTFIVAMLCFLCLSSLTLGILVMRRKLQPLADLALPTVWFAVIEAACFFPIACLFFLGITTPVEDTDVTDRVYQSGTLIIIALNATIFTPCLEFVKFFFGHKISALGGKPKSSEHGDDSRILDSPKREKSDDEYDVAGGTTV